MTCDEVRELLPAYVDAELHEPDEVDAHLAGCADCRNVLASYGVMLGDLALLADSGPTPPPTLAARVRAALPERTLGARLRGSVRLHPVAYAAGLGGAAIAAAAVAFAVRRSRSEVATA
jgi:predicted anti-sigma-YlaC factor YlaD